MAARQVVFDCFHLFVLQTLKPSRCFFIFFYLLHLEEVLDGRNVAGTFRPPVVLHVVADLRTNTGCRRSHSDHTTP